MLDNHYWIALHIYIIQTTQLRYNLQRLFLFQMISINLYLDQSMYYYSQSFWPFINILKYMTSTLEQDLLNSQFKIITLFKAYQQSSQQNIKSSFNNRLYKLLESIASFDHKKIKKCQSIIKDKTVLHYLNSIADKIYNATLQQTQYNLTEVKLAEESIQIQKQQKIGQKQVNMNKQGFFSFAKVIQQVKYIYKQLIQEVKIGNYLSQRPESKIIRKVLKEMSQSAIIYSDLIDKLNIQEVQSKPKCQEVQKSISKVYKIQQEDQNLQEIQNNDINKLKDMINYLQIDKKALNLQNEQLLKKLTDLKRQNDQNNVLNLVINKKIQQINKENTLLISINNQLKRQISLLEQKDNSIETQYLKQIAKINEANIDLANQINQNMNKIKELQIQKDRIYQQLMHQKKNENQVMNSIINESKQQKLKVLQQLKFIQQKQINYIINFNNQQLSQRKIQENQFLSVIFNKRFEDITPVIQQKVTRINIDHNKSIISQLSEIVVTIADANLDRLQQFNQNYSKLYQKYIQYRNTLSKIASKSFEQTSCLNRCITKQKALLEVYRVGKQEAQQKFSKLQLQYDRLKKKLNQYKQQDHFNKTYLTKLRSSKLSSQDESFIISHQQKQQLTTQIDCLQRQIQAKNINLIKNQVDLEDLLQNNEQNYKKLLLLEKKCHNYQKQIKCLRQSKEKLERNFKLYELKLKNQKKIYDQAINQRQSKLKIQEANYERKLKLLKNELEQLQQHQQQLKLQNEQINRVYQNRIRVIQQSHQKIQQQLRDIIREKSDSDKELLTMISDLKEKIQCQREEKTKLNEINVELMQKESVFNKTLNDMVEKYQMKISYHRQSEQRMNNTITSLLQKYNSYKLQQQQFKSQYDSKLYLLHYALQESQRQSNELLNQINEYSQHIANLNKVIQQIGINHAKEKDIGLNKFKQLIRQNQELRLEILLLKTQNESRQTQNNYYQEIILKMSQGMARFSTDLQSASIDKTDLQQRLMLKNRQIQTLNNQLNKKSEQLIIKTQQLLEKDQQMLQHEQLSVIQKQENDELKNQISNSRRQSSEKSQQIKNLQIQYEKYGEQEYNHTSLSQQMTLQPKIKEQDIEESSI